MADEILKKFLEQLGKSGERDMTPAQRLAMQQRLENLDKACQVLDSMGWGVLGKLIKGLAGAWGFDRFRKNPDLTDKFAGLTERLGKRLAPDFRGDMKSVLREEVERTAGELGFGESEKAEFMKAADREIAQMDPAKTDLKNFSAVMADVAGKIKAPASPAPEASSPPPPRIEISSFARAPESAAQMEAFAALADRLDHLAARNPDLRSAVLQEVGNTADDLGMDEEQKGRLLWVAEQHLKEMKDLSCGWSRYAEALYKSDPFSPEGAHYKGKIPPLLPYGYKTGREVQVSAGDFLKDGRQVHTWVFDPNSKSPHIYMGRPVSADDFAGGDVTLRRVFGEAVEWGKAQGENPLEGNADGGGFAYTGYIAIRYTDKQGAERNILVSNEAFAEIPEELSAKLGTQPADSPETGGKTVFRPALASASPLVSTGLSGP